MLHWIAVAPYFRCAKTLEILVKTFFWGGKITCFLTKKPLIFGETLEFFWPEKHMLENLGKLQCFHLARGKRDKKRLEPLV